MIAYENAKALGLPLIKDSPWCDFVERASKLDFHESQPQGYHWFWGLYFLRKQVPNFPRIQAVTMRDMLPDGHWIKEIDDFARVDKTPDSMFDEIYNTILEKNLFPPLLINHLNKTLVSNSNNVMDLSNLYWDTNFGFSGFVFPLEVSFVGTEFPNVASFRSTFFNKTANFTNTKFSFKEDFRDTTFNKAVFHSTVLFNNAEFSNHTFFSNAVFSGYTTFKDATFSLNSFFEGVEFSNDTDFNNTKFASFVSFEKAVFF